MKIISLILLMTLFALGGDSHHTASILESAPSSLVGVWEIDLRPTPESEAYLKDFKVELMDATHFSGEFYETPFENGYLNSHWERIYFGFSTKDASHSYHHSGYVLGDEVHGITYCEGRQFIMPWSGRRK